MLDWIISNKEWIFSGAGVVIASAIFTFLRWVFKKHAQKKNSAINQSQKSVSHPRYPVAEADDLVSGGGETTNKIKKNTRQKFIPSDEKYLSPTPKGQVTFDYSNNNGQYAIGQGEFLFELKFSKASDTSIHVYDYPSTINTVALVKDVAEIYLIKDAGKYDTTSRTRSPQTNQIVVLQNMNAFYAAIKILDIKDDTRGAENDEITFSYIIQTNGSPDFTNFEVKKESIP